MLSLLTHNDFGLMMFFQQTQGRKFSFGELVSWMVIGLFAGVIAKILMPGKDPGGCAITMILGIGGAVLAGFLARHFLLIGGDDWGGFFSRLGLGVLGAIILLAIYRLVAGRRA